MAWTSLTFPFGSILTSTKMTQLYDNFQAFADKASGAPVLTTDYVTQAMIAADAVGDSELDVDSVTTSTQSVSAGATWTPGKGIYAWLNNVGEYFQLSIGGTLSSNSYASGGFVTQGSSIGLKNTDGSGRTVYYAKFGG